MERFGCCVTFERAEKHQVQSSFEFPWSSCQHGGKSAISTKLFLFSLVDDMYANRKKVVLASASPRRQQFMRELGLRFTVATASIDETPVAHEMPEAFALRMAEEKARAVASLFPDDWIVAGDTVVCLDGSILGKPADAEEASSMLMALSGRTHVVRTGICLYHKTERVCEKKCVSSDVHFARLSPELIKAYVATGEPLDKAGGYGIQGMGSVLVKEISGSYTNIVGLPLFELLELLQNHGVVELSGLDTIVFRQ